MTRPRWRSALFLLGLASCSAPPAAAPTPAPSPQAPEVSPDELCREGSRLVDARRIELLESIERKPIDSFARLRPEERVRLDALQAKPDQRLLLLRHGPRLAVSLPPSHPLGPVELLVLEDRDEVALHYPDRNQRLLLPRERLADLYDGSARSSVRAGFELELAPVAKEELLPDELPASGPKLRAVSAQLRFRYYPSPERTSAWTLNLGARLHVRDEIVRTPGELPGAALVAALPLLASSEGVDALAAVTEQVGRPVRFTLRVDNESKPAAAAPALRYRVASEGWVRMPARIFCSARAGYRELRARPVRPGVQLLAPPLLAGLRAARAGGPLEVTNRSAYAALLYLDGALLGHVAAGERMAFRGIPEGYYRIYARSPTGMRAFGPHDLYVPGPLTLR
jgi:hypothetical protein